MNRLLWVLMAVTVALPTQVIALSIKFKTVSSVKTDLIPIESTVEQANASPVAIFSNNVKMINGLASAHQYSMAAANEGSLAVLARSSAFGTFDSTGGVGPSDSVEATGSAQASVTIDDIIFTGPGFSTTTSINLDVSGSFSGNVASGNAGVLARSSTSIGIGVDFSAVGDNFAGSHSVVMQQLDFPNAPTNEQTVQGDLIGFTFPNTITLGEFTVSLDRAYSLELAINAQTKSRLLGAGSGSAESIVDFGSTLNFPTSGPVFFLPDGYSVNSISANIVNNEWLGTPVSIAAVPLPMSIVLFAPLLVTLLRFKRRIC